MDLEDELDPDLLMGESLMIIPHALIAQSCIFLLADMPSQAGGDFGLASELGHATCEEELDNLSDCAGLQVKDYDIRKATPIRHIDSPSSRQSLAVELASALEPTDESAKFNHTAASVTQDEEMERLPNDNSGLSKRADGGYDAGTVLISPCLPKNLISSNTGNSPLRQARRRPSGGSLREFHTIRKYTGTLYLLSQPLSSVDQDMADDTAFQAANEMLEVSLSDTDHFLHSLRTLSSTIDISDASVAPVETIDRQLVIEKLASSLIRAMYDFAKNRDEQARELKETEKAFAEQDTEWQSVLADLDPLPGESSLVQSTKMESRHLLASTIEEDGMVGGLSSLPPPYPASSSPASWPPSSQLLPVVNMVATFASFRNISEALVLSLNSIGENTQICKATNTNASRKLKSLYSILASMRSEVESVERSQAFIIEWELKELGESWDNGLRQTSLPGLSEPRRRKTSATKTASNSGIACIRKYSEQVRVEMKAASHLIESSLERARLLLPAA